LLSVFVRLPPSRIGKYTSRVLSIPSIWFASGIAVSEAATAEVVAPAVDSFSESFYALRNVRLVQRWDRT